MEGAFAQWYKSPFRPATTQEEHCDLWNVNPREFRDYAAFKIGFVTEIDPSYQHILDGAYELYVKSDAIRPIQRFIDNVAPLYGIKSRPVWELWEIDPTFYPSDYAYPRN